MPQILIVEDDDELRTVLKEVLEQEGYGVVEASDGRAAMEMQRLTGADLVITDLIMPEMDGIETIMALRKGFPWVKIIAMSGGHRAGPRAFLNLAKALGAHRTLHKPFVFQDMLEAVDELLEETSWDSPKGRVLS
ncbi:MAG: response regulator [Syntrophus sp. (in: bacteria)]|nr:response regulator [Syntrophus sp. (in: bacteria)]